MPVRDGALQNRGAPFERRRCQSSGRLPPGRCESGGVMTALLEAKRVTKIFGGGMFRTRYTTALEDFSLTVDDGSPSITCVVGESGSGKSTMARLLLGLETPTTGSVLYLGKDLADLTRNERRQFRREVQAVF